MTNSVLGLAERDGALLYPVLKKTVPNRTGPRTKACVCSHCRAIHHPDNKAGEKRLVCWYPGCKCRDYTDGSLACEVLGPPSDTKSALPCTLQRWIFFLGRTGRDPSGETGGSGKSCASPIQALLVNSLTLKSLSRQPVQSDS